MYHFMLGPGWEEGCKSCSFLGDHFDGSVIHLAHRDVMLTAVSRAPMPQIEAFKKRMGWRFPWVSSYGSDFNDDYHVSFTKDELATGKAYYNYQEMEFPVEEAPGASVFLQGQDRRRLPHLLHLRARAGHSGGDLQFPGPYAQGPR